MDRTSDLLRIHVSVFNFFGVWRSEDKKKDLLNYFRAFFFMVCLVSLSTVLMFVSSFQQTEFVEIIITPLYTGNAVLTMVKTLIFYIKTEKIKNFLSKLDKIPFFTEVGEKDTKISTVRKIKLLPKILGVLLTSLCSSVLLTPVILGEITTVRTLPNWYPFEWEGKVGLCSVLFIFEFSASFTYIILHLTADTFMACVLLIIGGQLQSLGYRLKNLPVEDAPMWRIKFKEYVANYNSILRLTREFENIFSGMIFTQTLFSCLFICLSAFALGLANDTETYIRFLSFITSMLYEVFLVCYAGDSLTGKSEKLFFDLYSSPWPDIPQDCRKMVLILSMRLNNPIVIRFGFIQSLLLQTFTKIVDAAYKLYALLQQVPE
ncbi:unnamed protein product [Hermetia illucens]|uniref:Odorant receptor n=1 Tax=Hermetia illucens TaxID=343691 RepID=A0A7R8UTQ9_HERIL|nr:odorant receptor 46a-like [Hermetia illucens]CAD7086808.1 unnamed protein product [Hermetia illucens]